MADQPETVFSNETTPEQTPVMETPAQEVKQEATPVSDPAADLLKEIVREDGTQKYASVQDAITALKASQEFIETLKSENAQYKAEIEKRAAAEEVLEKIKATNTQEVTPSESLDLSQIDELVENKISTTLSAVEQQKIAKANIDSVISAMTDKFGEKAEEQFIATAKAAGLAIEQLNQLSATSPQAVLKLAGLDSNSQANPATINSSINTEALKPAESTQSVKVRPGATGKDLANAWRAAGQS